MEILEFIDSLGCTIATKRTIRSSFVYHFLVIQGGKFNIKFMKDPVYFKFMSDLLSLLLFHNKTIHPKNII